MLSPEPVASLTTPELGSHVDHTAGRRELIVLISLLMALSALSIDLMLPAFPDIRREFGMAADSSQVGWVITSFFLGLAAGPLVYGPISDRFGRRAPLFAGMVLYVVGASLAALAPSFALICVARVLWGLGAAAPRSLSLAIVRDRYEGDDMARLMSMILALFLVVPIVAPGLGAGLNAFGSWRLVFWFPALAGVCISAWAWRRLPETLPAGRRRPFTWSAIGGAGRAVVSNRQTMCFMLAITFLFTVLTTYISGFEIIVEDVYGYEDWFPLIFGLMSALLALSALNNARLVGRLGVTRLVRRMAVGGVLVAIVLTAIAFTNGGRPNFWLFVIALSFTVPLAQGLIPNANAAAMAPVPHVAGTASAIIATSMTAGGALLGAVITGAFDGTVRPFAAGLLACICVSAVLILFGATTGVEPQSDQVDGAGLA
ncbi:MAG: multidrug effflux MFS transporter [Ilumatobacteraceae bacterium]